MNVVQKLLAGYRVIFTLALVKPAAVSATEPAASATEPAAPAVVTVAGLLADPRYTWRKLSTLAAKTGMGVPAVKLSVIEAGGKISRCGNLAKGGTTAPAATIAPTSLDVQLRPMVASGNFQWRKISTLAVKTGATEYAVKQALIGLGCKLDRTENLVKVGSIGTKLVPVTTAPDRTGHEWEDSADLDDEIEEDDFNEEDEDSELEDESDLEDEDDYDDSDDGSDDDDEDDSPAAMDESKLTILREKLQSPNYRWRKLSTLAQSVQSPETETRLMLNFIGAREDRRGGLFRANNR